MIYFLSFHSLNLQANPLRPLLDLMGYLGVVFVDWTSRENIDVGNKLLIIENYGWLINGWMDELMHIINWKMGGLLMMVPNI